MINYAPADLLAPTRGEDDSLEQIAMKRRLAAALMQRASDTSPVGHWTQAAARGVQGIAGLLQGNKADKQDAMLRSEANAAIMQMLPPMTGGSSAAGAPPQSAVAAATQPVEPLSDEELGVAKFASAGLSQAMPKKLASALDPDLVKSVKGSEGFSKKPYWDVRQWTNGWGTRAKGPNDVIDEAGAEQRLAEELSNAQNIVEQFAPDAPPGVKKALTSLTYNAGADWTTAGLGAAVKRGDWAEAQRRFLQYNKADGRTLPGLVTRRQQEARWFNEQSQPPMALGGPTQAETAAAQLQGQPPMQVADASGTPDRATIERLLQNPYTRDMALKLIQQRMQPPDAGPASVQEFKFYESLSPERRQMFDRLKRDGFKDVGDAFVNPATGQVVPKNLAEKEIQEGYGKDVAKTRAELPEAKLRLNMVKDNLSRLKSQASQVLNAEGLSKVAGGIYETYAPNVTEKALNAATDLDNLKTKISGVVLQSMRDMSKTGGAVGQVTEREWPRLENMIANLDTRQGLPQFKERLQEVFDYADKVAAEMDAAYQADLQKAQMAPPNMPAAPVGQRPGTDLKSKYGLE